MLRSFRFISIIAVLALLWSCDSNTESITGNSEEPQLRRDVSTDGPVEFHKPKLREYDITFTNLTPATGPGASQPMSPPVFATHTWFFHIFHKGRRASNELAQLAEDAVNGPLVDKLNSTRRVFSVVQGGGVIHPGASSTVRIQSRRFFRKLSIASMLVNTNDAFAGLDGIRLPSHGSKTVYLYAYDAGTEKNTELKAHIPGPCCGNPLVRVPTRERIRYHRGISGDGDLDADVYGWEGAVAKVTITRVN